MNLEEIKKQISDLQSKVAKLENENKKENKRWRARIDDKYFCVDGCGEAIYNYENNDEFDNYRYKTRNYFKTEEEAEEYQEIIITYYDLMDLAEELNNGEKIDWCDKTQRKYYIYFDLRTNELDEGYAFMLKEIGKIYCLNINFKEKAIEKIGEDKLKKLFTYERN